MVVVMNNPLLTDTAGFLEEEQDPPFPSTLFKMTSLSVLLVVVSAPIPVLVQKTELGVCTPRKGHGIHENLLLWAL